MRPVDRGEAPQTFQDYADAKPFLASRLGLYCSYCERPIKTLLAVEHVLPKSLYPELRESWSNFLLGCANCNSAKGDNDVRRDTFLLPDQDNTFLAFDYLPQGQVLPAEHLDGELRGKAAATLQILGLDKFPDEINEDEEYLAALERWQQRQQAWEVAAESLSVLGQTDVPAVRQVIVQLALATGFFSVWMHVFANDLGMRTELVSRFPGTARDCFDVHGVAMPRPNGQV